MSPSARRRRIKCPRLAARFEPLRGTHGSRELRFNFVASKLLKSTETIVLMITSSLACLGGCRFARSAQEEKSQNAGRKSATIVGVAAAQSIGQKIESGFGGPGVVSAYKTVVVRSRIDGEITELAFREGQRVRHGDLLAVIDPRPYRAVLSQLEATLAKDEAALQDARATLNRYQELYNSKLVAQQQVDTQAAAVRQVEGTIRVDQAQIESARLNLMYTRITSPIEGRVGLKLTDEGNVVHSTDSNGIVIVNQVQPIAVLFTVPGRFLPNVLARMSDGRRIEICAYTQDDEVRLDCGALLAIDSQSDTAMGSPKFKGILDNKRLLLWPNQPVNVRILNMVHDTALVSIPASAIRRAPGGLFVYVVKRDETVERRSVDAVRFEDDRAVIGEGLKDGEVVVTETQELLEPGARVQTKLSH